MKNSIFVFIFLSLSTCAISSHAVEKQPNRLLKRSGSSIEGPKFRKGVTQKKKNPSAIREKREEKTLPVSVSPMTSDLMYEILSGELAYQRGQTRQAYEAMMGAARGSGDPRLAQRAAEMAIKSQPREAIQAVRLWHQLAPQSKEAERYLLIFLIIDNNLQEAGQIMSGRLKVSTPKERIALMSQYQQYLSNSPNKALAFSVLEEVLKPYMYMPEAHTTLAFSAYINKDNTRSIDEAKKALELKPDSELAMLMMVQAVSNPKEATELLSAFLKKHPKSPEVRLTYARLLIGLKEYSKAMAEFEKLHAVQPNDLMYLYSLGLLALQQKDIPKAEKYLKQYLEVASKQKAEEDNTSRVIFLLAQIAEERGEHDAAIQWLDEVGTNAEGEAWLLARIKTAQILVKKGDLQKARVQLATARAEYPTAYEQLILAEAQILRDLSQYEEAYSLLKDATERNPDNTNLLYDFALNAEKLNRLDEMEKALRHIIELDPKNQQAYNALGYSYADRNIRLDEAYELIDKALKLAPNDAYIIDSMGWVLFRQGNLEKAEQMLRLAYSSQKDPEIGVHLAEVLWVMDRRDEAKQLWMQVKEKDPKHELLNSTLKRLGVQL